MCLGQWDEINFSKVPSVAMFKLRDAFKKHVPESFEEWMGKVKGGEAKINASQVYPHTLVAHYGGCSMQSIDDVVEQQWEEIVKSTKELGTFEKSLVVSDVSGSMHGIPMEVSVALGILIATCTSGPFEGLLITFDESPKFHSLRGLKTLRDKVQSVRGMDWGGNTNLQKVFEMVLQKAVDCRIPREAMPERIYILSDMQFDECTGGDYGQGFTNFEGVKEQYSQSGYDLPQIVFWNLRSDSTRDVPVASDESNVALISGFSPSILKAVMNREEVTPYWVMRNAIDDSRYDLVKRPSGDVNNIVGRPTPSVACSVDSDLISEGSDDSKKRKRDGEEVEGK